MKKDFDYVRSDLQSPELVNLFILDDRPMLRDGLRMWLRNEIHFRLRLCGTEWKEICDQINPEENNILITTSKYCKSIMRELQQIANLKVICFCDNTTEIKSDNIFNSNIFGIMNYTVEKGEFLNGLRNVVEGKLYISTRIMQNAYSENVFSTTVPEGGSLTKREQEVVTLISLGYSDKEIGEILHLSKRTIDGYRNNLLIKFNARNSAHLIRFAIDNHLILPDEELKNSVF